MNCKPQCQNTLSGRQLVLSFFFGLALLFAQPIEALCQQANPARQSSAPSQSASSANWLLWGGPTHDFITATTNLSAEWPAAGPKKLWSRTLGDGYSGIAVEGTTLYTGFRRGGQDVFTALDATTGKTIWEFAYDNPFTNEYSEGVGPGPYAMPQVVGDRLITASGTGKIHSLDKKTGKVVWSHDLYKEFNGTRLIFGYSCHALPYKDNLIFLVGGRGNSVMSFRQSDGAVVWKNLDFTNAHSAPLLIEVDGQPQVVALMASEVIGFNPDNGELLWQHAHATGNGLAISTPIYAPGNILFISSAYNTGSRALELHQSGGKTTVKELWYNQKLQSHFGTTIRRGDFIYLSSGHNGPAFMSCVNLRSGQVAWQQRGFAKAQLLGAGDKLVLLDEDGTLGLMEMNSTEFRVLAKAPLLERIAWTAPTLSGTKLYVRDRRSLMALDLVAK